MPFGGRIPPVKSVMTPFPYWIGIGESIQAALLNRFRELAAGPVWLVSNRSNSGAMALYAEYDEVLMPNLRLNEVEVAALIEYMAAESLRVQQTTPVVGAAGGPPPKPHHH